MKLRILAAFALLVGLIAPSQVFAQAATTLVVGTCGTSTYVAGTLRYPTQDTTGAACSSSGGGGGSTNATASAAALPVVAGTGKPLNIDLFSQARVLIGDTGGNPIDWTAPVPIMGANGTTILSNANPAPISDAGGSITVDGTVAATQSGAWSITNITGTITLPTLAATSTLQSSVQATINSVTANNAYIRNGSDGVVVNFPSATNALNSTGTDIAPTQGVAQCDDVSNTSLTEGNFGNLRLSCTNHSLIVRPYESAANSWSYAAAASGISNTTTAVTVHASCGSGLKNYVTGLQLSSDALGAATEFAVRDGAGGTVLWRMKLGTGGVAAFAPTYPTPFSGTAATLLEVVTLTASVTGAVYVDLQGYCAP